MKSPTKPNGEYDVSNENISSIVENFREKLNSENLERIVLFVFGITGSGKDTLLNHLYSVLANKTIIDKDTDDSKGRKFIKGETLNKPIKATIDGMGDNIEVTHIQDWIQTSLKTKDLITTKS